MNIIEIIIKKKNNKKLTQEEINYVVKNYVNGVIADYQMSALLMAMTLNGLDEDEIYYLTKAMIESGDIIDLSQVNGITVDKHSTGGVGDKTTIALVPILASLGFKVAKMSGRGLGHTGGTIDKLESIKGYQVNRSEEQFIEQVNKIGVSVISQTSEVAIADKKIYALRDVTGLAESIPLIASSIMSKKIASSASMIVIDVKVGNGALMKNVEDATTLANIMIQIGKKFDRKVVCLLTNMEQPLGYAIGNGLEVEECIQLLQGKGPDDLRELVIELASIYLEELDTIAKETAREKVQEVISSGKAYQKFIDWITYQNGDINQIDISKKIVSVKSTKSGILTKIDAYELGNLAKLLGAGRTKKEDQIDYSVGFVLNKKVGDMVLEGEEIVKVYLNKAGISLKQVMNCFEINDVLLEKQPLIIKEIK
ncbi:MAG: thymidine phosphorylase [Tenericutes bacterium]|nr:thymidine phosphorylase [Mycoplasmatota bacterium]